MAGVSKLFNKNIIKESFIGDKYNVLNYDTYYFCFCCIQINTVYNNCIMFVSNNNNTLLEFKLYVFSVFSFTVKIPGFYANFWSLYAKVSVILSK